MSIEILSQDILKKAHHEKDTIETNFKLEITNLEEESKLKIISFKEKLKSKYDEDIANQKEKVLGNYKRESKKEILKVKNKLMDEIYSEVYLKLIELETEKKIKLYLKIISNVQKNNFKIENILCSKKDSKIVKEIIKDCKIEINENIEGLLFTSKSGKEILDMTFKTMLKETFENSENKIQKILFNL